MQVSSVDLLSASSRTAEMHYRHDHPHSHRLNPQVLQLLVDLCFCGVHSLPCSLTMLGLPVNAGVCRDGHGTRQRTPSQALVGPGSHS